MELLIILRVLKCVFGTYEKVKVTLSNFSGSAISLPIETQHDIYKTLTLPTLTRKTDYKQMLFNNYDNRDFNWPTVEINGHLIRVDYQWRNSGPFYDGTVSFFKDAKIEYLGNNSQQGTIALNTQYLFNQLNSFITIYKSMGYLYE